MKKGGLFLFIILGVFACQYQKAKEFSWLIGDWERINGEDDKETYEGWERNADGLLKGEGLTISGVDTVFMEHLSIEKYNEDWALVVRGINEEPTYFTITSKTSNSFVSENETNEFPKKIAYAQLGDTLKATISDKEMSIDFIFLKK